MSNQAKPSQSSPTGDNRYPLETRPPEALVIHCADPRFQVAFRRFATEQLGMKNYAPLVIGGGIHAVGSKEALPENFDVLWNQIRFFISHAKISQVILINHADCAWYKANVALYPDLDLATKEKTDLALTAEQLGSEFPDVQVRLFWAELEGDQVKFIEQVQ